MMYPADGPQAEGDCAIWGYQAQAYFNDQLGKDCTCRDADADCSN